MCDCKGVEGMGGIGATRRFTSEGFGKATRKGCVRMSWEGNPMGCV